MSTKFSSVKVVHFASNCSYVDLFWIFGFDHVREKVAGIAKIPGRFHNAAILLEMPKCDPPLQKSQHKNVINLQIIAIRISFAEHTKTRRDDIAIKSATCRPDATFFFRIHCRHLPPPKERCRHISLFFTKSILIAMGRCRAGLG